MRKIKQGAALAFAATLALAGSFAFSTPAMAASTPIGACGGGSYHVINKRDLGPAVIYLLYNGTTNCVVTWKDKPDNKWVSAVIRTYDINYRTDEGYFSTYAGPVKVNAAGQCIKWGGDYGDSLGWTSPWMHCG
ncbi:spore-associated protein A [Nonomuraea sp. NPDC049419]|uniref:spore-associated protein A n=1 Tax=Nonomuraea sp. NPDC049419 TaxID=3155772 RepID=UPI00342F426E